MTQADAPDAKLLIASGCAHCPAVLTTLCALLKQGRIGRLDVVNIAVRPEVADAVGARGVPWIKIGPFELVGAHSADELAEWVARAARPDGRQAYIGELLEQGNLAQATRLCRGDAEFLPALLALAADADTPLAVRIGIAAVLEDLGPEGRLSGAVEAIASALVADADARLRADGAHFLGLTGNPDAAEPLRRLRQDPDPAVREIATEALARIVGD